MRLSKRGEYGLRAMIFLAGASSAGLPPHIVQLREISEHENIPAKFLEQILFALKNAGLLHSKMGNGGGYYLVKPASEITLGQIFRVLDGPLAPIHCVSELAYVSCLCPSEKACGLRLVMNDVRTAITAILDHTSLADVVKRQEAIRSSMQVTEPQQNLT